MAQPQGFIVVLHGEIIEIPQDSYLAWLTMFYVLPKELVEKRPAYLELPRNINYVRDDEKYLNMIEDDVFLELVWDCWAWSVWQFFKIPHQGWNLSRYSRRLAELFWRLSAVAAVV